MLAGAVTTALPSSPTYCIQIENNWQIQPAIDPIKGPVSAKWITVPATNWRYVNIRKYASTQTWVKTPKNKINSLWYRTTFNMPQDWAQNRIVADFHRIEGDAIVILNGKRIGELQRPGGYFELTSATQVGDNELLIFLTRNYTGISRNFKQDKLRYLARKIHREIPMNQWAMGITAPVEILRWANPAAISDVIIQTSWQDKQLKLKVELDASMPTDNLLLQAVVKDADGMVVQQFNESVASISKGKKIVTINHPWANPIPWQLDQAYLYTMEIALCANAKIVQQVNPIQFGFREITIEKKDILINGKRSPWRLGSSIGGMSLGALSFYRMAGRNVIYYQPHAKQWWSEWDESPYYDSAILHEANETGIGIILPGVGVDHLRQALITDPQVFEAYQRELEIYMRRYRNHPCVMAWAVGMNTMNPRDAIHSQTLGKRTKYVGPQAKVLKKIFKYVKTKDPTRLVYSHADGNFGDIATANIYTNFAPVQEREDWLEEWSKNGDMPYMAVECGNAFIANYIKHHQVLITEYLAMQLGPKVYKAETPAGLAIVTPGTHSRWNTCDYLGPFYDTFREVQQRDVTLLNRAWRTWGESAGHFPWDYSLGLGEPTGKQSRALSRYAKLKRPLKKIPDWVNENFRIHRQSMQPLLAYIAGSPQHTDKTHSYQPGQAVNKQLALVWDGPGACELKTSWQFIETDTQKVLAAGNTDLILTAGTVNLKPLKIIAPAVTKRTNMQIKLIVHHGKNTVIEDHFNLAVFPELPVQKRKINAWLWDPKNQSTWVEKRMPEIRKLNIKDSASQAWHENDLLIIGREAMAGQYQLPFTSKDIASGLRVLILQQQPKDWQTIGLKSNETYTRRNFAIDPKHPVMQGLLPDDLVNWTAKSTLLPDDRQARSHDAPRYPRVNNRHIVSPVVLQIPERVGFKPILVSGFDLNDTSLLQWRFGKGSVLFSTLAISDQFNLPVTDPVAIQIAENLLNVAAGQTVPTRQTYMLGNPKLATQLGVTSVGHVAALDSTNAANQLWIIASSDQFVLPKDKEQSFLAAGGYIAYLRASDNQLKTMGFATSLQKLRKVSDDKNWPVSLPLNLARWRDELDILTFNTSGQPKGSHVMGKGIALLQNHEAGQRFFLQVTPSLLTDKQNIKTQQKQNTQISSSRLLQLVVQWLTEFGATSNQLIAARLTTMEAGSQMKWLKHWNVLGPVPADNPKAKRDELFLQKFKGHREAIEGNINPNFTYKQTDGSSLNFRKTVLADESGFVDLLHPLGGKGQDCLAMTTTTYFAEKSGPAILKVGVDYWCQVFVNGKLIYQTSVGHGAPQANKHQVRINLNKGINIITLKVLPGSRGFGFWANIAEIKQPIKNTSKITQQIKASFYTPLPYPFDPYEYHYW